MRRSFVLRRTSATHIRTAALVAVTALLAGLLAACSTPPAPPGDAMQVAWGATVYRLECARCHNPDRVAAPLTEERLARYRDAATLFAYIQETMPLDKPGALPEQDYWDVTAYLLANAQMLPGQLTLGPGSAGRVDFAAQ